MSVSDESHIIFTYYRVSNPTGPHQIWNWKYENSEGQIRSGSCELCKSSHRDSSCSLRLLATHSLLPCLKRGRFCSGFDELPFSESEEVVKDFFFSLRSDNTRYFLIFSQLLRISDDALLNSMLPVSTPAFGHMLFFKETLVSS